jgi:multiple sugar transport system substrate-binding protein
MPKFLAYSLIALVVMAPVASCTRSPNGPVIPAVQGNGPGSGTIVWLADPTAETATDDVRQVLADAFEKAYPSISIELETGPDNTDSLRSLLARQLSARSPTPDVYDGDVIWSYAFAHNGYALPLSKYLPRSFWDMFGASGGVGSGASMVRAMTYRGAIYGVPEFVDEGFLYYRKDLLARAGLKPPRTWEQLAADAMVLKRDHLPYQFAWQGNNYEGLTCVWYEFMADAFGQLPPGASPAADLDSPQSLKALDFLRDLINDGISPRNVDTFEETDADIAFDSGQAAFMRGWDSSYSNAVSAASSLHADQVGVELPPAFQPDSGPGWSALGGWGLFINPHTRNLQAALTFVKWIAGPQAQWILATQYSEIPANASVRDNPAVIARSPVLQAAANARVVSRPSDTVNYPQVSEAIHAGIYAALPGPGSAGENPCVALVQAARALDPGVTGRLQCPAAATASG